MTSGKKDEIMLATAVLTLAQNMRDMAMAMGSRSDGLDRMIGDLAGLIGRIDMEGESCDD